MTEIKYENYKELKEWKENLENLKNIIHQSSKTQFGGKALIGNKPAEFLKTLNITIIEQQKVIQKMMDDV